MLDAAKKLLTAYAFLMIGVCCVSCYKESHDPIKKDVGEIVDPENSGTSNGGSVKSKLITFGDFSVTKMDMSVNEQMSRSEMSEEDKPLNHFLVVDVVDGKPVFVHELHEAESHNVLSDPVSIDMAYGKHDVYFLCCENRWANFDSQFLTLEWNADCQILKDVWAKHVALDVNEGTEATRSVKMDRCVSYVRFIIEDAIPVGVSKLRMQVDGGSWTYDLRKRCGAAKSLVVREVNVPGSYVGQSGVSTGIYTFVPANTATASRFDIFALGSDGTAMGSYSVSNVPIKVNRYTPYSGRLFQ